MAKDAMQPSIPLAIIFCNYFSRLLLIIFGYFNDFLHLIRGTYFGYKEDDREFYTTLYDNFTSFYYRNIAKRYFDAWGFPISSKPGTTVRIMERIFEPNNFKFKLSGRYIEAMNFGSYNYLDYAQNSGQIVDSVEQTLSEFAVGMASTSNELGRLQIYSDLEQTVAQFLGVEDAIVFGMGFATNSLSIPALFGKRCLVISDELNHASIILGCRLSGAVIKVFKHNDMKDLERTIRESIVEGQPRTKKQWRKILIIVEGIYSMEATIVNLPQVIDIKKKYKVYLYLDEAHSIGALGPHARGVCDYYGCDPRDVDIMMGTFTKSFGAAGGYIAGTRRLVEYLRESTASFHYANPMSPPVITQISSVIKELMQTTDVKSNASKRVRQLHENARYFRQRLIDLGFHVEGPLDSPVVPVLFYIEAPLIYFVREMLKRGIATPGVAFPGVSILKPKLRICLSSGHTRQMLDHVIDQMYEIGCKVKIVYNKK